METLRQRISRASNTTEFIKILKAKGRWDPREAEFISARMMFHRVMEAKPNLLITLNSKRTANWALSEDDKVRRYREFQRSVGLFIKHYASAVMPKEDFLRDYEQWFRFFAFFEDTTKAGEPCKSHFHILMKLPDEIAKLTCESDEIRNSG